jgi:dihydrofolate reductase
MRRLTSNTFVTLDGVMQAPGGPEEDTTDGFAHGGWGGPDYWDDMMGEVMSEWMGRQGDVLLGRKTYEIFAGYWPTSKEEPTASQLNKAKKWVASRTLDKVEWKNSHLIKGDVPTAIAKLKDQDGPEIQVHGSGNLIQTLLKHNLIDEFRIWTFPVLVGPGKRLFAEGTIPSGLKVVDSKTFSTGVVLAIYEPAGEIKTGSFATEEPTETEEARRDKVASEG